MSESGEGPRPLAGSVTLREGMPPPATREPGLRGTIRMLLELVKFEHSIFALPYAYIGALYGAAALGVAAGRSEDVLNVEGGWGAPISGGQVAVFSQLVNPAGWWPTWWALLWITVVMVGARSFAFVVNRAADKEIDSRNPRTAGRAVPAGLVKAWEFWLFAGVVLGAYLFAVFRLAPITRLLWPIPLAMFLVYPYTKRFTRFCHMWLGACLGLAPVGAWVAVGASIADPAPWVLGAAVAAWTAGFDIIYATQDIECDRRDGIRSIPADLGVATGLHITRALHVLTVVLLALGGYLAGAGTAYFAGLAAAAALLAYENSIVSPADLSRVNAAFFTTNGVIAMVLLAGTLVDRVLT